ncbi:MAG: hypothetical protein HY319_22430 [Armatimonadetes bacterium]|nr:hypothetical protein [Armatimonadota bacterium]
MSRCRWASFFLLLLALGTLPGTADVGPVEGRLFPALGGNYREERELPVVAELKTRSSNSISVEVRVSAPPAASSAVARVELTPGTRRRIPLLSPVPPYGRVDAEFESEGITDSLSTELKVVGPDDLAILVLAPEEAFSYLSGYQKLLESPASNAPEIRLSRPPSAEVLPERWPSYSSQDIVVVKDLPFLGLGEGAQRALVDWARAGGVLVLVSSQSAELTGTPFAEVAPLPGGGIRVRAGGVPMLHGNLRGGSRVLVEHDGLPLLVGRAEGAGRVLQITAPISRPELLGPAVTEKVWGEVVAQWRGNGWRHAAYNEVVLLQNPPEIPVPNPAVLAWFLVGYAVLVGPVNYGLLRRKDRMLLSFVTVPAIALLFAVGAFSGNLMSRSGDIVVRDVGIAHVTSGDSFAVVESTSVFFSPRARIYELSFGRDTFGRASRASYVDPGPAYKAMLQGDGSVIWSEFPMAMWSMVRFRTSRLLPLQGPLSFRVSPDGRKLEVDNRTGLRLTRCRIFSPAGVTGEFSLGPGSSSLELEPAEHHGAPAHQMVVNEGSEDEDQLVRCLGSLWGPDTLPKRPVLAGWTADFPAPVDIAGIKPQHHSMHLVTVEAP